MNNKFQRECPICKKVIKSGRAALSSFEEMFERHLKKHKLYAQHQLNEGEKK